MTTLSEIEAAAAELSAEQKQELLLFLAQRLRIEGQVLPPPRSFSIERIAGWITEDEADAERLRGKSK